jgi:hypothetical protein
MKGLLLRQKAMPKKASVPSIASGPPGGIQRLPHHYAKSAN